jgi:hypothetical protein
MKVGVRDIAGKYNIYANVSGKYRPHPAPERTQSSVSGSTGGEFKTDVLKNNNTKNDLTLGMDVSGDDTQSAPPDAETKMTGRNRSETVSPYAKLKINKRVGLGGNATGTSTASTDAYSEYTGKSADLYLYGQYAPPDKDTESKNKSDQQRLIGNVKIGAGATWMVDSEHDYDVVQTVDGSKKTLYAKPSLGTNEKHDLSFYLGGKPRFNIVTGTQNGEYFSVSSWAGLEWTPGFNSLSLDVSHYFSQFNDLRYKHTDPETDYYWPEGVYNTEYQEVEIDVAGTLVPTSRLNLDFSGSAVQGWGSGDLSPTDDTSLTATFSAEWLVIKDPNIVFGVEGSWNRGTSVGKMPPTTNTRSDDTYVGISLGSSYNRVGRRN